MILSVSGYKAIWGITDTSQDVQITAIIPMIEDQITRYLGFNVVPNQTYVEVYDGTGNNFLRIRQSPITSITSITVVSGNQTATYAGSQFIIDSAKNFILINPAATGVVLGAFPAGQQNITVTYVAGSATADAPPSLKLAISLAVNRFILKSSLISDTTGGVIASEKLGDHEISYGNASFLLMDKENEDIRAILSTLRPVKFIF